MLEIDDDLADGYRSYNIASERTQGAFMRLLPRAIRSHMRFFAHEFRYNVVREIFANDHLFNDEVERSIRFPKTLMSFVTNICNARCTFCQYDKHIGKKQVLDFDAFKKSIDEFVGQGSTRLCMTPNNGDPLVDKGLFEKIEYARNNGIDHIFFSTNGILLNRGDIAEKIIDGPDMLRISMPGLDPETYQRVYGVDKAKELEEGLVKLAEAKKRKGGNISIHLDLRIDQPVEEVMNAPGMRRIQPYIDDGTLLMSPPINEMFDWSGSVQDDDLTGTMFFQKIVVPKKQLPCNRAVSEMNAAVLPNGGVRVCDCGRGLSNEGPLVIGNIMDTPLTEIISGDRHRNLLRKWMEGDVPEECRSCAIYQPNSYSWKRVAFMAFRLIATPSWWKKKFARRHIHRIEENGKLGEPSDV